MNWFCWTCFISVLIINLNTACDFKMGQGGGISDVYWHFSGTFSMYFQQIQKLYSVSGCSVVKPVGWQPRLCKGMLDVVLGGRWSCSLHIYAFPFRCGVSKEVSWISAWAFAQHWPKTTRVWFGCSWECRVWSAFVPGPEKWVFLAPGTLPRVTGSSCRAAVADLPSFLEGKCTTSLLLLSCVLWHYFQSSVSWRANFWHVGLYRASFDFSQDFQRQWGFFCAVRRVREPLLQYVRELRSHSESARDRKWLKGWNQRFLGKTR